MWLWQAPVTVFGLFLKGAYVRMLVCMETCQYLSRRPVQTEHDFWYPWRFKLFISLVVPNLWRCTDATKQRPWGIWFIHTVCTCRFITWKTLGKYFWTLNTGFAAGDPPKAQPCTWSAGAFLRISRTWPSGSGWIQYDWIDGLCTDCDCLLAYYCLYNGKLFLNVQGCNDRRTKVVGFIVWISF